MIDIVIAIYNPDRYFIEQINSLVKQTYWDKVDRVIIVDDSVTKSDLVDSVISNNSKFEYHKNLSGKCGAKDNFAFGLSLSTSDYVMTCDQDDIWLENKIEDSLKTILSLDFNSPCLVSSDVRVVDGDLNIMHDSFLRYRGTALPRDTYVDRIVFRNAFPGCTMLFNRRLLEVALPIPDEALMHDWWLISVASICGEVGVLEQPTMLYRQHERNCLGARKGSFVQALRARSIVSNMRLFSEHVNKVEDQNRALLSRFNGVSPGIIISSGIPYFISERSVFKKAIFVYKHFNCGLLKALAYFFYLKLFGVK